VSKEKVREKAGNSWWRHLISGDHRGGGGTPEKKMSYEYSKDN
jgi:hypothetical protein